MGQKNFPNHREWLKILPENLNCKPWDKLDGFIDYRYRGGNAMSHILFDRDFRRTESQRDEKLNINCFGHLTLSTGDKYISINNKKGKELLAYLLCAKGAPVLKTRLAAVLWPSANFDNAMSSLYKVCKYLRNFSQQGAQLPIKEARGELRINNSDIACDIYDFDICYNHRDIPECCAAAVELYSGQIFYDECYEWITPFEAYYDVRYIEMTDILFHYYASEGNIQLAEYYQSKLSQCTLR